jgi:hypothetical protein
LRQGKPRTTKSYGFIGLQDTFGIMPEESNNVNPTLRTSRRRFRFSLRTMLLATTVLCVWLGIKVNAAREQRQAVAAVRALGGKVRYDYEIDPNGTYRNPGPELGWYELLFGVDLFNNVVEITVSAEEPDSKDYGALLPHLRHLTHVRDFRIEHGNFHDDDLRCLADLPDLEFLGFVDNPITGEGFKYLTTLNKLEGVAVIGTTFTDAGAEAVSTLPHLKAIRFNNTNVTDFGVEHLKALPGLRSVSLHKNDITDKCIDSLATLANLKDVYLSNTRITRDGIRKLQLLRPSLQIECSPNQRPSEAGANGRGP